MDDKTLLAVDGTLLGEIIYSCQLEVSESAQVKEVRDEFQRLLKKVEDDQLAVELEGLAWCVSDTVAEEMFLRAWKLRGNPDLLIELPAAG